MPCVEVEGLMKIYRGGVRAVDGLSFRVDEGEAFALLGPNGAGKSTTLKTILGIIHPSKGKIVFNGNRIEGLSTEKIVRLGISMVPERREIFPEMTVKENLEMGAFIRNDRNNIREDIKTMFRYFPILKERQSQEGGTLSGGEQQMLAIARGLMSKPKLLLLDELSLGLSPLIVKEIIDIVKKLNEEEGIAILLVEQNANLALSISQYAYVLENGAIAVKGKPSQLINDERIKRSYIGE